MAGGPRMTRGSRFVGPSTTFEDEHPLYPLYP